MFERVLICTDFSDGLQRLAHFVPSLVVGGIRQIIFLHVVPLSDSVIPRVDSEKMEQARTRLAKAVEDSSDGIEVKIEVRSGQPVGTILMVAQSYQSDLIVMGSQSRTSLAEKLIGSSMVELSHQTTIPILILRPQLISVYTSEELTLHCQHLFRSLLVPYDGSEPANFLVQQVKRLAEKQSGRFLERCVLCWVVGRLTPQQAREALSQVKADLEGANLQVEVEVRQGSSVTEVLIAAQGGDFSAIAVSSGTIGKLQKWFIPSFAAEILRQSWYPVLFFPLRR